MAAKKGGEVWVTCANRSVSWLALQWVRSALKDYGVRNSAHYGAAGVFVNPVCPLVYVCLALAFLSAEPEVLQSGGHLGEFDFIFS